MTNKEKISSWIEILESQIRNYDRDLKSSISDYGDASKITPLCPITNLQNMSAMASEIKCRKFALDILKELKQTISD